MREALDYLEDNYGDLDLLATTALNFESGLNYLFRNERGNQNNWINLLCIGTTSNRAAIGAKVWVTLRAGEVVLGDSLLIR